MLRTTIQLFSLNLLFSFSLSVAMADDPVRKVQQIIDNFGKDRIAGIILDARGSEMTIDTDGYLHDSFGRPPRSKINARSIARDLDKMGWQPEQLHTRLEQVIAEEKKTLEDARRAESGKKQSATEKNKAASMGSGEPEAYEHYCMKGCQTSTMACLDSGLTPDTCTDYHDKCMFQCIQYYQIQ
jgi:hypothetical protein